MLQCEIRGRRADQLQPSASACVGTRMTMHPCVLGAEPTSQTAPSLAPGSGANSVPSGGPSSGWRVRSPHRKLRWVGLLGEIAQFQRIAEDTFFVSHAHRDARRVHVILDEARAAGHAFWIDRADTDPGGREPGAPALAIRAALGVVVFWSPAASTSDHVRRAAALAARFEKPILPVILPVILAGARPPDRLLSPLANHLAIDIGADPDWRIHFLEALDGLRQGRSRLS